MSRKYLLILISSMFLSLSCEKEDIDYRLPYFEIPIIKGYTLRDCYGEYAGRVGVPNVKNIDYNSGCSFGFYPNPAFGKFMLYIKSPRDTSIKKLWITFAQYENQLLNNSIDIGMNNMIAGGMPLVQIEFKENNLQIDLTSFQVGYYRIYLIIHDVLLFDNLVIYDLNT